MSHGSMFIVLVGYRGTCKTRNMMHEAERDCSEHQRISTASMTVLTGDYLFIEDKPMMHECFKHCNCLHMAIQHCMQQQ